MTLKPEVLAALDRMCEPLHESVLSGVTAECDARCMAIIRSELLAMDARMGEEIELAKIHRAIEHAAKTLPEGYVINIGVENGAAWSELCGPVGMIDVDSNNDGLAYEIADAVQAAITDDANEYLQGGARD